MKIQMKVFGVWKLKEDFRKLNRMVIHPQLGIADCIDKALNQTVIKRARRNVWSVFNTTGDFPSRIKTVKINQYRVDVTVDAVYGAVHEYGGTFTITERQRRFFWARWYATGEEMWKALALSVTYTIPARPYLRPAIDAERTYAMALAADCLAYKMKQAVGR